MGDKKGVNLWPGKVILKMKYVMRCERLWGSQSCEDLGKKAEEIANAKTQMQQKFVELKEKKEG